jgi:ubiquinone/menaquinone biosynthesis C-methylase UbiE
MNKVNEKNIAAYDKMADNYDNTNEGKFTEKFKSMLLSTVAVNDGDSVLDVGCGNGTLLSRMAKLKSIHGYGTDISSQMIKNATSRYPEFKFAVSDCERIPFDDGMMDIITVCAAYHHFPDVNAFAAEAKRLLAEKGSIYIAEIYLPFGVRFVANIFLPLLKSGDMKFYSCGEIVKTFSDEGFNFVEATVKGHIQVIHMQKTV